jgi:polyhydroxyalkanoate synthesis regulator phasin
MSWGSSPDDHFSEAARPLEDALYDLPVDDGVPLSSEIGVKPEDLEDQATPEKGILEEILERVRRIEEQLEKGGSQVPPSRERRSLEDMFSELIDVLRRMERSSDEISELSKRVRRIEEAVANVRTDHRTSDRSSEPPSRVYGPTPRPQLLEPQGPMPVKAKDAPGQSSEPED